MADMPIFMGKPMDDLSLQKGQTQLLYVYDGATQKGLAQIKWLSDNDGGKIKVSTTIDTTPYSVSIDPVASAFGQLNTPVFNMQVVVTTTQDNLVELYVVVPESRDA
jgi:hypothetical protein